MTDMDISDAEIAVMRDIARASGLDLDADKQELLDRLMARDLVAVSKGRKSLEMTTFAVTSKGQRLLDERGVGVNES